MCTSPTSNELELLARHEAGHLLMLWLLDRQATGCAITADGGITQAFGEPDEKEAPYERLLYTMSGMVLSGDIALIDELCQHANNQDHFEEYSDSYRAVEALQYFRESPEVVIGKFVNIIKKLGRRFERAYRQAVEALLAERVLNSAKIHSLFDRWDEEYNLQKTLKSDIVCSTLADEFGWRFE